VPLADKEIDQESLQQALPGMAGKAPEQRKPETLTEAVDPDDKS
jgi:hypothetical protein